MALTSENEVILVWPDGDWVWLWDHIQSGYAEMKSDDYETVQIPNNASNEDVDLFVEYWVNSSRVDKNTAACGEWCFYKSEDLKIELNKLRKNLAYCKYQASFSTGGAIYDR